MLYFTMLSAAIFTVEQLAIIIAAAAVTLLLLVGNIVLYFLLRRHKVRKLCTTRLQAKRNELLNHLKDISDDGTLVSGGTIYSDVDEEDADDVEVDDEDDEEDEEEDGSDVITETVGEDEDITQNEILAVADMSEYTRHKLGYDGEEYDRKRYYVRYKFGFEAKLRAASDVVKERYLELIKELMQYKGIKLKMSFKGQRIYKGRKTLGIIMIRGKTLCVALALDPKEFVDTKYYGIDMSDKKRFEKTPMLYKLTSMRRVEYSKYLIMRLSELNMILPNDKATEFKPIDLSARTPDELFVAQALRIAILGEAPEMEPTMHEISVDEESGEATLSELESTADEDNEELSTIDTPEGRLVLDRSFTARLCQSDIMLQTRYSELKNYILSYKGTRSRVSWKHETFSHGRKTIATFAIRGKTLLMYLATDPAKFADTKYKVENMSEFASRKNTPLLFRIKSNRRTEYAKQLIDLLFEEIGVQRVERRTQDYTITYRSTDMLIKRGLIKVTRQNAGFDSYKK